MSFAMPGVGFAKGGSKKEKLTCEGGRKARPRADRFGGSSPPR